MAPSTYRRLQTPIWFALMLAAIFGLIVLIWQVSAWHFSLWGVTGFALLLLVLFFGLRVEVTEESLKLSYGIGIIQRSIPRSRIKNAIAVRNKWYWGFGIRLTPRGWMWNISGLDAVELEYPNGKNFRVGTEDPDGLLAALGFGAQKE